jgi:hypothetical protein
MKILTAALLITLCSVALADTDYPVRTVDFPGATNTYVFALNNAGHFVGAEVDPTGVNRAIFDDGRQLQTLKLSGPASENLGSFAFSINNRDDIAGAFTDSGGVQHGYVHHADGTLTQINFPGASSTQAYGVNDWETVIGIYTDAQNNSHAFLLRDGRYLNVDLRGGPSASTTPLRPGGDRGRVHHDAIDQWLRLSAALERQLRTDDRARFYTPGDILHLDQQLAADSRRFC